MKIFAAVIAVLLSAFLWMQFSKSENSGNENTPTNSRVTHSRRPSPLSPREASPSLRHLQGETSDSGRKYDSIVGIVSKLSDSDLRQWALDLGFQTSRGYDAWIRSAIYSEWARRDLDGVLSWLREPMPDVTMSDSTLQQISFAIFEGSKPTDPVAALDHLNSLRLKMKGGRLVGGTGLQWVKEALQRTYADMAKFDHEMAWKKFLAARESNFEYNSPFLGNDVLSGAVAGIFEGLPAHKMEEYADTWMEKYYNPDLDKAPVEKQLGFRILKAPNPINNDLIPILSAWIQKSPDAAREWSAKIPGDKIAVQNRVWQAHSAWAKQHPEQALASMQKNNDPKHANAVAVGMLRGDAHLASAFTEIPAEGFTHFDAMMGSFTLNTMLEGSPQYPSVDQQNRPPDYQQRYESFSNAVQSGEVFSDREKSLLQESLDRQFRELIAN